MLTLQNAGRTLRQKMARWNMCLTSSSFYIDAALFISDQDNVLKSHNCDLEIAKPSVKKKEKDQVEKKKTEKKCADCVVRPRVDISVAEDSAT